MTWTADTGTDWSLLCIAVMLAVAGYWMIRDAYEAW